jgi:16S rRNA (guanine527-N7)-methyltransferase
MNLARISELLHPFLDPAQPLTEEDLNYISTYIDILTHWNSRINLTAIRDPEDIVTRHFGESLFAARHLFPRDFSVSSVSGACPDEGRVVKDPDDSHAKFPGDQHSPTGCPISRAPFAREVGTTNHPTVADVGSGAGFPGIPIKLWVPHIALTLIESNQKKSTFLREITRALTLTHVDIQNARAETLPEKSFDVVALRAVERFEDILPIAANLVAPTGRLALLISSAQLPHAQSSLPNLSWSTPLPVPQSRSRIVVEARLS